MRSRGRGCCQPSYPETQQLAGRESGMVGSVFENGTRGLSQILADVGTGRLQVPGFRGGWEWDDTEVRDVIASVALGYPIGVVTLLEVGGELRFTARPVDGVDRAAPSPAHLILDGQQRITSLFRTVGAGAPVRLSDAGPRDPARWFHLHIPTILSPSQEPIGAVRTLPADAVPPPDGHREVLTGGAGCEREFRDHLFPLARCFEHEGWLAEYQLYHGYAPEVLARWQRFEDEILATLRTYQLPVVTLTRDAPREAIVVAVEKVLGVTDALDAADVVTATLAAEDEDFDLGQDLEHRHRQLIDRSGQPARRSVLAEVPDTGFLQALALVATHARRKEERLFGHVDPTEVGCTRRHLLRLSKRDHDRWADRVVDGFAAAARFLHEEHVFDARFVPSPHQLIPLAALLTVLGERAGEADARAKLRRWFWCGVFGEGYPAADEARFAADLVEVLAWIDGGTRLPASVREAALAPERLVQLRTRSSAAYRGFNALLLREGARDWRTGETVTLATYQDRSVDVRYVFPRAWCRDQGIDDRLATSIVNKTPLPSRTARLLGDAAPSRYLAALAEVTGADAAALDDLVTTHRIDPAALRRDDLTAVVHHRARALLDLAERAMRGELVVVEGTTVEASVAA